MRTATGCRLVSISLQETGFRRPYRNCNIAFLAWFRTQPPASPAMKSALSRILPVLTSPAASPARADASAGARQPQAAQSPGAARSARGSVRGRLAQLFDMKKVPFEPAVSVERWDETTTLGICERWAEGQRKQPSIV